MAMLNFLDGTMNPNETSNITHTTLTYSGLINDTVNSFYVKNGSMCVLYLPSLTSTPTATSPSTIQITVDSSIAPKYVQYIHGFTVNDSDGTPNCVLGLAGSNVMTIGKETTNGTPDTLNYTSNVSITRYTVAGQIIMTTVISFFCVDGHNNLAGHCMSYLKSGSPYFI